MPHGRHRPALTRTQPAGAGLSFFHDKEVNLMNSYPESTPVVKTRTGRFAGTENAQGTKTFRGIPYARFNGRWRKLLELPDSSGLFDARCTGPACPQVEVNPDWVKGIDRIRFDEENCFHLDVSTSGTEQKKPVFVFIHGGANICGGTFNLEMSTERFVDACPGIVSVIFNYRLGPLGTLCLDELTDDEAYRFSGNLSMLDQVAALRWIHENIAAFGGDPDRITIAGQSSGSASVHFHTVIPESWPYWARAICQSGTCGSQSRAVPLDAARAATRRFCDAVGADSLEELLRRPVEDLLTVNPLELGIIAVEDGITLPKELNGAIYRGDPELCVSGKTIMLGCMNGDMDFALQVPDNFEADRDICAKANVAMLHIMTDEERLFHARRLLPQVPQDDAVHFLRGIDEADMRRLQDLYLRNDPDRDRFFAVSDCLNDYQMIHFITLECDGYAKRNQVYLYLWTWAPASLYPRRGFHAQEIPFLFCANDLLKELYPGEEALAMSRVTTTVWSSFVVSGTPVPDAVPYDPARIPVLRLDLEPEYLFDPRAESRALLYQLYREKRESQAE
jgi:carboxylesterase type B